MKTAILSVIAVAFFASEASAQNRYPSTLAELVTYGGADREQVLYTGAKAEGKVAWYTSLAGDSYKAMVKAFEAKYPEVKVEVYRVSGSDITTRMTEEAQAKRYIVDAIETTEGNLMFMREAGLLRPYYSPQLANYPESAKAKAERNLYYWAVARESYIGFAYNKNLVPPSIVPKNFEGLLHPQLKGKMGMTVSDPSYKVIGAIVKTKGEELVRKLKIQEIRLHAIIPPALLDFIASGEVAASPAIFRNHTLVLIEKGGPVDWVPLDLVPTNVGGAALPLQPPHPHAGLLMVDFLLSPQGQSVLEKFQYGSASKNYGFKRWRPEENTTTEKYEKDINRWEKLLRSVARK